MRSPPTLMTPAASRPTWRMGLPPVFALSKWIPIRSLTRRHRPRILTHLLRLDERDRYMRFGYPATDEQLRRYVETLDFTRDELFGVFNRRLELVAMAHLAHAQGSADGTPSTTAEFGCSVLACARGRGWGHRLFERVVIHARNRGVQRLFIHALSDNTAMLNIARKAGASVEREGSETEAWLRLPPENVGTHLTELVEEQAAEIDYQLKAHARRMNRLLAFIREVKAHLNRSAPAATE